VATLIGCLSPIDVCFSDRAFASAAASGHAADREGEI